MYASAMRAYMPAAVFVCGVSVCVVVVVDVGACHMWGGSMHDACAWHVRVSRARASARVRVSVCVCVNLVF